jgi:hypothetical protein
VRIQPAFRLCTVALAFLAARAWLRILGQRYWARLGQERTLVTGHRFISPAPACALLLFAAALGLAPGAAHAQNACSGGCKAAYGSCYKSTHDRAKCQGQLQRCLEGCIHGKHWRSAAHVPRPASSAPAAH